MVRHAVMTGIGVVSPFGDEEALASAMADGRTVFGCRSFDDPRWPELGLASVYGAFVDDAPWTGVTGRMKVRELGRESRLFLSAGLLACRAAGLDPSQWQRQDVGVSAATMFAGLPDYVGLLADAADFGPDHIDPVQGPRSGFNAPASYLAIRLGAEAENLTVASGTASGVELLTCAADSIEAGRAGVLLAGGVDTLSPFAVYALRAGYGGLGQPCPPRPFDRERRGPVFGEGAVVCVVEEADRARARGATPLATIAGSGSAFRPPFDERLLAEAAHHAITGAVEAAGLTVAAVDAVIASASGHDVADAAEARALYDLIGDRVPVYAVKGTTGEWLGASGALQAAAALLPLTRGILPLTVGYDVPDPDLPPIQITRETRPASAGCVLVLALDPRGHAAALVLTRGDFV